MAEEIQEHHKTIAEAVSHIKDYYNYSEPTCGFCGSNDLDFPFLGFEMCNDCGKHTLFKERFHFLEVSRELLLEQKPEITKEKVFNSFNDNQNKYDEENKLEGKYYYWLELLINEGNIK